VVAAALLEHVKKTSEDLQDDANPDALHDFRVAVRRLRSWTRAFDRELRDSLKGKPRRRLDRLADATRASRDLEVHIEWVDRFASTTRRKRRAGTTWLLDRLRAKKTRADLDFRRALDADLARAIAGFTKALNRYTIHLDEPWPPFARTAADLVRAHATAVRKALASVTNIGDRIEGHEARIAAKRLRYLLEPLRDIDPHATRVVEHLSRLQDDFGALHDAQLFGSDIARLLAKVLASTTIPSEEVGAEPNAEEPDDRADLLLAIARRLHRDEVTAFDRIADTWLADRTDALWTDVEAIASSLSDIADEAAREPTSRASSARRV
jgi:CHAD domain-containing protein